MATKAANRIAWLLRVNRLYGPDDRLAVGSAFAAQLRGGQARGVDAAQLTRWERAKQPAGYPIIRQYEQLLGLPSHRLVVVADMIYREVRGGCGRSFLDRGLYEPTVLRRSTTDLLDRALGGDVMSGMAWDTLTTNLWALPQLYLYPQTLWNDLADRLLAEMILAEGAQWLRRGEALSRLLGHPQGELPVIAACAALASDQRSQVVVEPLMVLESSRHPDAAGHVMAQISDPTNEFTRTGAWWSAAEKLEQGHFDADQITRLKRLALDIVTDSNEALRVAALEVLRQLPATRSVERVLLRMAHAPDGKSPLPAQAQTMLNRVCATVVSRMPRDVLTEDPMLRQAVAEMLFHPQLSTRFVASSTLLASPYRLELANAISTELRQRTILDHPDMAPAMVGAIGQLGDGTNRPFLQELALGSGLPDAVTESAIRALAHCPGTSPDAFWSTTMHSHGHLDRRARSVVYALGIARHETLLTRYRRTASEAARAAAGWWLNIPVHIAMSTSRRNENPDD